MKEVAESVAELNRNPSTLATCVKCGMYMIVEYTEDGFENVFCADCLEELKDERGNEKGDS